MTNKGKALAALLLISSAALSGCGAKTTAGDGNKESMPVATQTVKLSDIGGGQVFTGSVTPTALTNLASKITGRVTDLKVKVGDSVRIGQAIADIDTSSLQQQLQQSQSAAAVSQAQLQKAQDDQKNGLASAQKAADLQAVSLAKAQTDQANAVNAAKQQVALAQAQLDKANKDQQTSIANAKQAVALAQLQLSKAESDAATAIRSAQNGVDTANQGVNSAQTGLANNLQSLQQAVQAAQAAYDQAVATQDPSAPADLQKLQQAQLSYQQAQSNSSSVLNAQNQLTQAEAQLQTAENSQAVQIAQQQYNQALLSLASTASASQAVLQQQLNQAETSLQNTQASSVDAITMSKDQLAQAEQSVLSAQSQDGVNVSQASLMQALTNVHVISEQLQDGTLTSPVNGLVTVINTPVGQLAGGSGAVVTIASTDPTLVTVNVPEAVIGKIKTGTAMDVNVPTLGQTYTGKVYAIHPTLDSTTKSYGVDIQVDDPKHQLLPGMFAEATLQNAGRQAILVPADAVLNEANGEAVFVVENGKAKKVEVQVGQMTSAEFEITSGLKVGDQLVVQGEELLSNGVPVDLVQPDQPTDDSNRSKAGGGN